MLEILWNAQRDRDKPAQGLCPTASLHQDCRLRGRRIWGEDEGGGKTKRLHPVCFYASDQLKPSWRRQKDVLRTSAWSASQSRHQSPRKPRCRAFLTIRQIRGKCGEVAGETDMILQKGRVDAGSVGGGGRVSDLIATHSQRGDVILYLNLARASARDSGLLLPRVGMNVCERAFPSRCPQLVWYMHFFIPCTAGQLSRVHMQKMAQRETDCLSVTEPRWNLRGRIGGRLS